jgi:hypothetical protein
LGNQENWAMVMQTDNGHRQHGHSRDGGFTHTAHHPHDSTLLKRVEGMKQADLLYLLRLLDRKRQKVKRLDAIRRLGKPRLYALSFDPGLAQALMVALVTYHGLDLPEASLEPMEFAAGPRPRPRLLRQSLSAGVAAGSRTDDTGAQRFLVAKRQSRHAQL